MLNELHRPFVRQVVEKSSNVCVEHPVHSLRLDPHGQRVQRLVRVATWPEPVREAFEVHLMNLVEDGHHRLLNNLVLQRGDAQRALPPIGLRDVDSSRGLCLIHSTMDSAVKVDYSAFQSGLVLLPCHAIYSRRSLSLQRVETVPEQSD